MLSNPTYSNPKVLRVVARLTPKSYTQFVNTLCDDIDEILKKLSKDREAFLTKFKANVRHIEHVDAQAQQDKKESDANAKSSATDTPELETKSSDKKVNDNPFKIFEDDINNQIVRSLEFMHYRASHDKFCNGHVDIYVELDDTPYIWLGECKIWSGASNIDTGFKQLNNAYSTGEDSECCGGVISYIVDTHEGVHDLLVKWASMLLEFSPPKVQNTVEDLLVWSKVEDIVDWSFPVKEGETVEWAPKKEKKRNRFYSQHKHPSSGLPYIVRHFTLDLRHKRLD